jgi:hypothetical protein
LPLFTRYSSFGHQASGIGELVQASGSASRAGWRSRARRW